MSNYSTIKSVIDTNINTNGEGNISGSVLNGVLKGMIDALGEGYQFKGFAGHKSRVLTPDARVFYITLDAGTYRDFDGIEITKPSILYFDTLWHAQALDGDFSTTLRVSDIVNTLNNDATDRPLSAAMGKELVLRLEALREAVQTGDICMGVAIPATSAPSLGRAYSLAYIAATAGTYTNLGNLTVEAGEVAILRRYTNALDQMLWEKVSIGIYLKPTDVVDALNSTSTDKPLSAKQGKVLKDLIDAGYVYGGNIETMSYRTPVRKTFYLATYPGTYHDQQVVDNEVAFIKYNGSDWSKDSLGILLTAADLASYAKTEGYYETLGAGTADNLRGRSAVSEPVLSRITGGDTEIANGAASLEEIKGNSTAWNQLVASDAESVTVTSGHKYYAVIGGDKTIATSDGNPITVTGGEDIVIDLTLMFGDGKEPATVSQFKSWLDSNVGFKTYYSYDGGKILNAKPQNLISTGRNLLNPATGEAHLLTYDWENNSNTYEIIGTYTALRFIDVNGVTTEPLPDANGKFVIDSDGVLFVIASDLSTVCVQAVLDGTHDGEFVAFREDILNIDVTKIWGKLNGEGELVQVFPDGMKIAGSTRDGLIGSVATKRIGNVDMGTLSWGKHGTYPNVFATTLLSKRMVSGNGSSELTCARYAVTNRKYYNAASVSNKIVCEASTTTDNRTLIISDSSYASASAADFIASLNGVILNYVLETPLNYTNLVYREDGVDTPLKLPLQYLADNQGTERVNMVEAGTGETEPVSCAPILTILYAMDAVEEIDTLKTNGVMVSDLKGNIDALLVALNQAIAGIGTITVSETATDKVFTFTFTPAAAAESTNE